MNPIKMGYMLIVLRTPLRARLALSSSLKFPRIQAPMVKKRIRLNQHSSLWFLPSFWLKLQKKLMKFQNTSKRTQALIRRNHTQMLLHHLLNKDCLFQRSLSRRLWRSKKHFWIFWITKLNRFKKSLMDPTTNPSWEFQWPPKALLTNKLSSL